VVLALLETQVSGFGILGIGSIVSLIVGGLLLFSNFGGGGISPTAPQVAVSKWVIVGMAGILALMMLYVVRVIFQSRKPSLGGPQEPVLGAKGVVTTELSPRGVVQIGNETWSAVSGDGTTIRMGENVRVIGIEGLTLTVSRQAGEHAG